MPIAVQRGYNRTILVISCIARTTDDYTHFYCTYTILCARRGDDAATATPSCTRVCKLSGDYFYRTKRNACSSVRLEIDDGVQIECISILTLPVIHSYPSICTLYVPAYFFIINIVSSPTSCRPFFLLHILDDVVVVVIALDGRGIGSGTSGGRRRRLSRSRSRSLRRSNDFPSTWPIPAQSIQLSVFIPRSGLLSSAVGLAVWKRDFLVVPLVYVVLYTRFDDLRNIAYNRSLLPHNTTFMETRTYGTHCTTFTLLVFRLLSPSRP